MASGINNNRCFVYANSQAKDWHGKTQYREGLSPLVHFPAFEEVTLHYTADGVEFQAPHRMLISKDDNLPCGRPFKDSFGYITPQQAWERVAEGLAGTGYDVERLGMLWDRSFWFVSVGLRELRELALPGMSFQLNFSGALDGSLSPQGEVSAIRAVCWNTVSLSRAVGQTVFSVKQTRNSGERLANVSEQVEQACGMARVFNATMERLQNEVCVPDKARNIYAGELVTAGLDMRPRTLKTGERSRGHAGKMLDELVETYQRGDGNRGETMADVFNGFTQVFTRGSSGSTKDAWSAVESSEFGGWANRKANFLAALSEPERTAELATIGANALAN